MQPSVDDTIHRLFYHLRDMSDDTFVQTLTSNTTFCELFEESLRLLEIDHARILLGNESILFSDTRLEYEYPYFLRKYSESFLFAKLLSTIINPKSTILNAFLLGDTNIKTYSGLIKSRRANADTIVLLETSEIPFKSKNNCCILI